MKNLLKYNLFLLLISLSFYSIANQGTTVLLSENKEGNFTMDFLNENDVTAMQFDVVLSKTNFNKSNIGTCVTSLPKSHVGTCKIKGNILRVIIFSKDNSILESGEIGSFKLNNYINNLKIEKVEFVKQDASIINGDIILDRAPSFIKENNNRK